MEEKTYKGVGIVRKVDVHPVHRLLGCEQSDGACCWTILDAWMACISINSCQKREVS